MGADNVSKIYSLNKVTYINLRWRYLVNLLQLILQNIYLTLTLILFQQTLLFFWALFQIF